MDKIKAHLVKAKKFNSPRPRAFFMGNPSADMDSVLCAIVASWFYSEVQPTKAKVLYSPLVNVPRNELQYRFDICAWLEENGFDENFITENIFFYDDLLAEGK